MPIYKQAAGLLTYTELNLPQSENHVYQWLAGISDPDWVTIQAKANELLVERTSRKMKKSSLIKISKLQPRQISRQVYKESAKNVQDDEFLLVGGIFDSLNLCLESLKPPLELPLEESNQIDLSSAERTFCELLGEMYEKTFAHNVGDFILVEELSTDCSAFWVDTNGIVVLTIGAPVRRLRDIPLVCEDKLKTPHLARTLKKFVESFSNVPLIVVTHSYGYEKFMTCCEKPQIRCLIAFNPHSFQKYDHHPCKFKIFENGMDTLHGTADNCELVVRLYRYECPFALQHFYS